MTWTRPVEAKISDTFDGHKNRKPPSINPGTDYAVATGTPIKAIADGTISGVIPTFAGAGGRMIFMTFPSGHKADYLHMSRIDVKAGQEVKKGDIIGLSGGSGFGKENGYAPHLHLSFRMGGQSANGAGNIDFEAFLGLPSPVAAPISASATPKEKASRATIKRGSKGADVVYLQGKLGLKADGDFGPLTQTGVVNFQKSKGLTADGIVGPKTWAVIG
jgi:murein DD-endopeptidase MepM/ murein hydrolase activator NlpD